MDFSRMSILATATKRSDKYLEEQYKTSGKNKTSKKGKKNKKSKHKQPSSDSDEGELNTYSPI